MNTKDPLATFRATPKNLSQAETDPPSPEKYEAFSSKDRPSERLEIRALNHAWHHPSYRYLQNVIADARFGTELVLSYSFLMVKIGGRHLQPVTRAIKEGHCEWIEQFDADAFPLPDPQKPIITSIELIVPKDTILI
jgi:hypothetical protein